MNQLTVSHHLMGVGNKRGYFSMNDVVICIVHKRCEQWQAKKDIPEYEQWRKNHKCKN